MVGIATKAADWADQHISNEQELVASWATDHNPSGTKILIATANYTVAQLLKGVTDAFRVEDATAKGIKAGSALQIGEGITVDTLRLMTFAAPFTGAVKKYAVKKIVTKVIPKNFSRALEIKDVPGSACTLVSTMKAGTLSGKAFANAPKFANVEDLAKALGIPMPMTHGMSLSQLSTVLKAVGVKFGAIVQTRNLKTLQHQINVNPIGILDIRFKKKLSSGAFIPDGGHAILVFKDTNGELRVMDRNSASTQRANLLDEYIKDQAKRNGREVELRQFMPTTNFRVIQSTSNLISGYAVEVNAVVLDSRTKK
jgi:hypothetical protein